METIERHISMCVHCQSGFFGKEPMKRFDVCGVCGRPSVRISIVIPQGSLVDEPD